MHTMLAYTPIGRYADALLTYTAVLYVDMIERELDAVLWLKAHTHR